MAKHKTYFEQIPVEAVRTILEKSKTKTSAENADDDKKVVVPISRDRKGS